MAAWFSRPQLLTFAACYPGLRVLLCLEDHADEHGVVENVPVKELKKAANVSQVAWDNAIRVLVSTGLIERLPREFAANTRYQLMPCSKGGDA